MNQKLFLIILILLSPFVQLAHGAHGNGVLSGFTHPILGLDHAIAILATGTLGYLLNPPKWFFPLLAFTFSMIVGGLFGITNEATFLIEKIIALSVFVIGLIIAFKVKMNYALVLVLAITFGAFHGYAHGAEMSDNNTALKYISGYTIGTLLVGTVGMFLARTIYSSDKKDQYQNIIGGSIMGAGIVILIS